MVARLVQPVMVRQSTAGPLELADQSADLQRPRERPGSKKKKVNSSWAKVVLQPPHACIHLYSNTLVNTWNENYQTIWRFWMTQCDLSYINQYEHFSSFVYGEEIYLFYTRPLNILGKTQCSGVILFWFVNLLCMIHSYCIRIKNKVNSRIWE